MIEVDTTRPSLFPHSRNVTIHGGVFTAGDYRDRHGEVEASSHSTPKIPRYHFRSQHNLTRRDEWSFSIGEQKGEKTGQGKVIIQTFVGRRARQLWQSTIDYTQRLVNPNLLNIIGTSSEDDEARYILFDAAQQNNACRLIAAGLRQGERETTIFGTRIIYGIASGLDFLGKISPNLSLANFGIENFDVFSDDFGNTALAFTPQRSPELTSQSGEGSSLIQPPWAERNAMHFEDNKECIVVFNSLITKLFNDANHIIYSKWFLSFTC
ncbi:hypothetical protein GYMLUDRAFT_597290 [Collybiopsis luxurians FD-317 M1]|uniref:Uncharacterized protein n=1 Tax=Collybiopsis luxurians FD-317 M1 TaxID=944289 RepID=A0A0D0BYI4_9AGAR|nr:hypothetical protein GYMLUDRAFT_597290 [Collybiopsis luxurians FD-317 M1]